MKYTLTDFADNEMKDYALYTVTQRAIPSMIDSLKPVQRFYLYSSLVNSAKAFKKVSAVSGIVSDYGYNHGEVSAAGAGQLMAATWSNNICLIEGRGSLGTRLVQSAGAARYVYTRVSPNFYKYIKDIELSPEHDDPEHLPPRMYLPTIPLVLINGAKGIATGFATQILPRSEQDIIAAIKEYLANGKIKTVPRVEFPEFTGTTEYDPDIDRFVCVGTYKKIKKTTLIITEIPYGFDRETYIKVLDKLEDAGLIVSYEDKCNKDGFGFDVKLKQQTSANWTHAQILKNFKLSKNHSENLTVIDENGALKEYNGPVDLIKDFVKFRLGCLDERIALKLSVASELIRWLTVKIEFINAVLDSTIVFKGQTKNKVAAQVKQYTSALATDIDRLLALNILSLTKEQVAASKQQIKAAKADWKYWNSTTPTKQYHSDLDELA
jgi:DNA gyrase/topoisomerase IV subunit A